MFRAFTPEEILRDRIGPGATKVSFPLYREMPNGEMELVSLTTPGSILVWRKENPNTLLYVPADLLAEAAVPSETPPTEGGENPAWTAGERRFAERLAETARIPPAERQARFDAVRKDLAAGLKDKDPQRRNDSAWNAGEETFLLVKGALGEPGAPSRGGFLEENRRAVDDVVGRLAANIGEKMETRKLFARLGDFGDGCTLSHINRVFLQTMKFLQYFNFNLQRGLEATVERLFRPGERYRLHFERPFLSVFREGLKYWDKKSLTQAGVAGLLHDVGKIPNLAYFESDRSFDRAAIEAHALQGYDLLIGLGSWATEAAFVAGSHHEYGGHPAGYGIRRTRPEMKPSPRAPNLVSNDLRIVLHGGARDHLLTEVVQIVDIYDALRCSNRKYRKNAFTEAGTLSLMREMARSDRKLNLVLFDLFIGFTAADLMGDDLKIPFDASKLFA